MREGGCGCQAAEGQARATQLPCRAALGSPPGTRVSGFSVQLTGSLSFLPPGVFRLVDLALGFRS